MELKKYFYEKFKYIFINEINSENNSRSESKNYFKWFFILLKFTDTIKVNKFFIVLKIINLNLK